MYKLSVILIIVIHFLEIEKMIAELLASISFLDDTIVFFQIALVNFFKNFFNTNI